MTCSDAIRDQSFHDCVVLPVEVRRDDDDGDDGGDDNVVKVFGMSGNVMFHVKMLRC